MTTFSLQSFRKSGSVRFLGAMLRSASSISTPPLANQIVVSSDRPPRLVVDSSVSGVTSNTCLSNEEFQSSTRASACRSVVTREMSSTRVGRVKDPVSKTHRRIRIRLQDQDLQCFQTLVCLCLLGFRLMSHCSTALPPGRCWSRRLLYSVPFHAVFRTDNLPSQSAAQKRLSLAGQKTRPKNQIHWNPQHGQDDQDRQVEQTSAVKRPEGYQRRFRHYVRHYDGRATDGASAGQADRPGGSSRSRTHGTKVEGTDWYICKLRLGKRACLFLAPRKPWSASSYFLLVLLLVIPWIWFESSHVAPGDSAVLFSESLERNPDVLK